MPKKAGSLNIIYYLIFNQLDLPKKKIPKHYEINVIIL